MEQLDNLPDEVLLNIFSFFNKRDHGQASTVNKHFYKVSTDKFLKNLLWPLLDYNQQPYAVKTIIDNIQRIADSCMSTNGKVILSTLNGNLYIWDVEQNKCQFLNETHPYCILLALANGQVVSGARIRSDNTLKIWDINRGCCLKTLAGHTNEITALSELPNGHVVSAAKDNTLKVWDIEKGECLITINTGLDKPITQLISLSNGNILSGSENGILYLWSVIDNYKRYSIIGHEASISALVEIPTGEVLSASKDGTCKLWDMDSRLCSDTFKKPAAFNSESFITKFTTLPNKKQIACLTSVTSSHYSYAYIFYPVDKKWLKELTEPSVWIWDTQAKTYSHSLTDNRTHLASLYILPNGQIITLGEKGLQCWLFPELKFKHELTETDLSRNLNKLNFK